MNIALGVILIFYACLLALVMQGSGRKIPASGRWMVLVLLTTGMLLALFGGKA